MIYSRAVIASINTSKINGARRALELAGVRELIPLKVDSIINQPIGFNEIISGAAWRALKALEYLEGREGFGVGIEAGVIVLGDYVFSGQATIIADHKHYSIGLSGFFPLPENIGREVLRRRELGELMRKVSGIQEIASTIGAIGYLSKGFITRTDLSYESTLYALLPWLNMELYGELKPIRGLWEILKKANINP
jgi:inosine/xanthosine triphosphatase